MPPLAASTISAPSVGSPISASPSRRASAHSAIGSRTSSRSIVAPPSCSSSPFGAVALAADREAVLAGDDELAGGHLVQRERAGLVRADRRDRAERLDRRQALDDGVVLGEHPRAHRVEGGDDGGQAGRDGGDGQRDAGEEQLVEGLVVARCPRRIITTNAMPAMPAMITVSRSSCFCSGVLSASVLLSRSAMLADLGVHPGAGHDHLAAAAGDRQCS